MSDDEATTGTGASGAGDGASRSAGEAAAERYRRLAAGFTTVVEAIDDRNRDEPSPCEGWSAAEVVGHVVRTERDLLERSGRPVGGAPDVADDALGAWASTRDAVQAALDDEAFADAERDGPFGPTSFASTVDTFMSFDLLVHRWDLARAIGRDDLAELDPGDVAVARDRLAPMGDAVRSPGVFGPEAEVAPDAPDVDRFLAWTGRRP